MVSRERRRMGMPGWGVRKSIGDLARRPFLPSSVSFPPGGLRSPIFTRGRGLLETLSGPHDVYHSTPSLNVQGVFPAKLGDRCREHRAWLAGYPLSSRIPAVMGC